MQTGVEQRYDAFRLLTPSNNKPALPAARGLSVLMPLFVLSSLNSARNSNFFIF